MRGKNQKPHCIHLLYMSLQVTLSSGLTSGPECDLIEHHGADSMTLMEVSLNRSAVNV